MIIKLDTSVFKLSRQKAQAVEHSAKPLTKEQWVNADRLVISLMFLATIIGAILF